MLELKEYHPLKPHRADGALLMTAVPAIPRLTVIEADQRTGTSLGSLGFLCIIEAFSVQPISPRTFAGQFPPLHSKTRRGRGADIQKLWLERAACKSWASVLFNHFITKMQIAVRCIIYKC